MKKRSHQKKGVRVNLFLSSVPGSKTLGFFLFSILLLVGTSCTNGSSAETIRADAAKSKQNLYVIEREIPGVGKLTAEELQAVSLKSNDILDNMDADIQWLHSYVTGDKIYCVYTAPNEEMVREHARKGGFPANSVSKVGTVIDPTTADK